LKTGGTILAFVIGAFLLLLVPAIHAAFLIVNFLMQTALLFAQAIVSRLRPVPAEKKGTFSRDTFISIHVPAHNEPPEVLCATLQSLSQLNWENFEVLVIDNNTSDETVWRPIEECCAKLGERFRFFHVEGLKGAKAGAMNYIRPHINRAAEFVLVVDADYQLDPDAIEKALPYFTSNEIGLVQFPQHYRNSISRNSGVTLDFQHFFSGYMNMANQLDCVPSTGTLSFINLRALRTINGFDTEVVTEDAELGFRLNVNGYRTVYVHEVIGHGLMPFDLESLKKQRWRWAFGNAQILKRNLRPLLLSSRFSWKQKIGFLTHLTAWFNFNLLPSLSLVLLAPLAFAGLISPLQVYLLVLSGFTLVTFALVKLAIFYLILRREKCSLREILSAYCSHLGLGMIFATSWIRCLINDRAPFVRTNKFRNSVTPHFFKNKLAESLLGFGLLSSAFVLVTNDFVIAPLGALVMAIGRFAIFWIEAQLKSPETEAELVPMQMKDLEISVLETDDVETEAA
jgi:cellulose synthase/poly-beta-1,6-N-acetylglucosamine synthase-like glycosyltransferase